MITEGVIPIAARDLIRVVFSCVCGSAVAGGLSMIWGCGSPVPHGGMLSVPLFTNPVKFCIALAIGSMITAVILSLIKNRQQKLMKTLKILEILLMILPMMEILK